MLIKGIDGHSGISCMIFQTAGSNATEVNQNIDRFLEEARKDLPQGVELTQMMSSNDFLFASIHEVVKTLLEAILLVILVVYVFLQGLRSTLVPLVGIIVSLIGTFAFMSIAEFSINLITLFALVLVIGTVVDDAIVVVEAVQERFDVGYRSPYMASIDAMKGISSAIFSSSWYLWPYSFRFLYERYIRYLLHPVRIDNGRCRRYIRTECLNTESCLVCPAATALYG